MAQQIHRVDPRVALGPQPTRAKFARNLDFGTEKSKFLLFTYFVPVSIADAGERFRGWKTYFGALRGLSSVLKLALPLLVIYDRKNEKFTF